MGVRINFVREVPQDLQCLPRISNTCVVEDVSTRRDILILEFRATWQRPPISLGCRADTASAACPSQPGNLAITSFVFAAVT